MIDPHFQSMPADQARDWHLRAAAGDTEAVAFFRDLFPPDAPCWLCDRPSGAATVSILPDPAAPGSVILAAQCGDCASLPDQERRRRELKMLRAFWPKKKWRAEKSVDPRYLRGAR